MSILLPNREEMISKIDQYVIDVAVKKRKKLKLSQAKLAYELEVSIGFIGKIESENYPTHYNLKHINRLSEIFKCSPKDFVPEKPI